MDTTWGLSHTGDCTGGGSRWREASLWKGPRWQGSDLKLGGRVDGAMMGWHWGIVVVLIPSQLVLKMSFS